MIRSPLALALFASLLAPALAPSSARADIAPPRPAPRPEPAKPAPAPAVTVAAAAARPAGPPAELDRLKFMVGTFACDGSAPVKGSVDHAFKGKFTSKATLGGYFVGWQWAEVKAKDHPTPMSAEGHLSWDGGLKRYLLGWADSNGLATLLRAEPPSDVDQLVFKGTATASFGRHVPHQFTVTRTPKGFDLLLEGTDNDGQLSRLALLSCAGGGKAK